jgi:microcystin degradation protein MlrC
LQPFQPCIIFSPLAIVFTHSTIINLSARIAMRYLTVFSLLVPLLCMNASLPQSVKPRIAVAGISHESNSFFPSKTVLSLHDGKYIEPEIRHGGGRYFDQGLSAVIEMEGSTRDLPNLLLLTSERSSPNSLHQLISCGIYPERQKILVAKGAIAPRAAYEPIAGRFIEVDTPGPTTVNPARFTYKRARRPLFGLDQSGK